MELVSSKEPQLQIISVKGSRIDAAAALAFKDQFRDLTDGLSIPVVLDLTQVEFIDSSGLGAIVSMLKVLSPERPLILAGLSPAVERVLALTRMDRVFKIHKTLEQALSDTHEGAA